MEHKHSVYDTDTHFTIAKDTRQITLESKEFPVIVQHDHNSERFSFDLPRYIDGHDMLLCNEIQVHYLNTDSATREAAKGVYTVKDIAVLDNDENTAVCSWLISENATQYAGKLNFMIRFACLADDGTVLYRWNTGIYSELTVVSGYDNGEAVIEDFPDILAQWKAELFGVGDTEEQRLLDVSAEQQAAIAAEGQKQLNVIAGKAAAVLDSIPDEYEAVSALTDRNHRNKAGAIVLDAEGESIVVNDASEYPLMGLKVFGKSTQDGTPTPGAPIDIVSVENAVVVIHGKNLFPSRAVGSFSRNGVTYTHNGNGSIAVSGEASGGSSYSDWIFGGERPESTDVRIPFVDSATAYANPENFVEGVRITLFFEDLSTINLSASPKTIPAGSVMIGARIRVTDGTVVPQMVFYPQIELGSVATEYEPYKESQTIAIPRTLPGIPVASGGNYTDANGQQWICDEVDLVRGVYVQRIRRHIINEADNAAWTEYNNNETQGLSFVLWIDECAVGFNTSLCNRFRNQSGSWGAPHIGQTGIYSDHDTAHGKYFRPPNNTITTLEQWRAWLAENEVELVYILASPIETPLTDAEITAFKALCSNKPTTTILNDAGAYMAVEYVADTKLYIDRKISELIN